MDKDAFERVIAKANVGARTAAKLRKAFDESSQQGSSTQSDGDVKPVGHGSPTDKTRPLTTF